MKTTDEITDIINTYHATTIEAHNLAYLMGMRKELAIKAFELGKEVSNYKYHKEVTTAQRKTKFAQKKLYYLQSSNLGKSELLAEEQIEDIRLKEAKYDGLYMGCKIVLEQTNEVISSIMQDVSQLRLEYKNQA